LSRRFTQRQGSRLAWAALTLVLLGHPGEAGAQTTGQIIGRITDAVTKEPIATAEVRIDRLQLGALTSERGDFIIASVPTGEYELVIQLLGYRTVTTTILVRAGRTIPVNLELTPAPVEVEGVTAEVERVRLVDPEATVSQEIILGRDLLELPIDNTEQVIELTTGVTEGHFRGGRVGQETYRIDGLEVRDQFSASGTIGGIEVSPYALSEIEVVTGGTRPEYGSAISGAVSYVTRRGNPERWEGRAEVSSDGWLPDDAYRGFSSLSASLGGPLGFGDRATIFADVLAQGFGDSDPRARGLTCLQPGDGDDQLAGAIGALNTAAPQLYCPYTASRLPYQRGDRFIGLLRWDQPLATSTNLTLSFIYNRRQSELYTPEFKYNPEFQQGQRTKGYLATATLDWGKTVPGRAYHVIARAAAMRLDRYLGVVDPGTFSNRTRIAGFGFSDFEFLGEEFARSPIEAQLESGSPVPGYVQPGGVTGSPFGPAAEGLFFTQGTPGIAAWNRNDFLGGDLVGEVISARGHSLRGGGSLRFYQVENYERVLAYSPGSSPSYARFYPTTANAWAELSVLTVNDITAQIGVRYEGFESGLSFQQDRSNVFAPVLDTEWKSLLMPRIGVAIPIPTTENQTMVWFNFGKVAQPPDFRFFLDSTIGDSLRADIRRQGNPNLAFEQGVAYEFGMRHMFTEGLAFSAAVFLKELTNLVTSGLAFSGAAANQFTTGDFGNVQGLELTLHGRWPAVRLMAGYALMEAVGVGSGAFEVIDSTAADRRLEFPLAFDRRHSANLAVLFGRAAGAPNWKFGASLSGSVQSGYPLDRQLAAGDIAGDVEHRTARLPWTNWLNLRASYDFGGLGVCQCSWRVLLDARNILGTDNVIALRRDTGELAPRTSDLEDVAVELSPGFTPIPIESPRYSAQADLDRDGVISLQEFETARFAAALDASDPSLYFGQPFQLRLGLEIVF
jgi:hypothetical protein